MALSSPWASRNSSRELKSSIHCAVGGKSEGAIGRRWSARQHASFKFVVEEISHLLYTNMRFFASLRPQGTKSASYLCVAPSGGKEKSFKGLKPSREISAQGWERN
jgi:hypothetical protein